MAFPFLMKDIAMTDTGAGRDDQDQSEVFDEDNFDPAGAGAPASDFRTFEELPDVLDVTRAAGDGPVDDLPLEDPLSAEGVEPRADERPGQDAARVAGLEAPADETGRPDEIELVYAGDLTDARGARGSAAPWESRRLDDDDLEALGYAGPAADACPSPPKQETDQ
jgi:hypothetical protein